MTKIKIVGILIFALSIISAVLFSYTSYQNKINSDLLNTINEQKAFTQEISKNIFYIYKNKNASPKQLDNSIKAFLKNMESRDRTLNKIPSILIKKQSDKIITLWNKFYLNVQKFRNQSSSATAYTSIILEQLVKDIYNINIMLIVEFDELIKIHQVYFHDILNTYKNIQYILFITLVLLLLYLFTQIKDVIAFIHKFLNASKKIITSSSIKELEPIDIQNENSNTDISQAADNFNFLVEKINNSIQFSSDSMQYTSKSLEQIEENIEDFIELLAVMDENKEMDLELTKKEDAVIQSLEELMNSALKLKDLKTDLDNLISQHKIS